MAPVSLEELVACVDREIAMRVHTYPRWVAQRKMTAMGMELEMTRIYAVRDALLRGEAQRLLLAQLVESDLTTGVKLGTLLDVLLVDVRGRYPARA